MMEKETNMPASIQQPPPPPPQKNIKNVILVEVAREIKEVINEAVEKNDSNTGSLRKIMCSVENKILKKHQASSNNLNYFTHVKTKVPSTTIKAAERGQLKEGEEPVIDEEVVG